MAFNKTSHHPNKWAILIGIDKYTYDDSIKKKTRVATTGHVMKDPKNLNGCVNDVLEVRQYLQTAMKMDAKQIKLLLAPVKGRNYKFQLPEYEEPTYENIIRALAAVPTYAKQHDLVYIHYSGHGGQASTVFQQLKQKTGDKIDHSLMPTDVALAGGRYLRDVELGALLQDIVQGGAVLTVVLDCCHSGGAIRGEEDTDSDLDCVRGEELVYKSDPTDATPVRAVKSSVERWGDQFRWMQAPSGFVVLAACLDYQKAKEMSEIRQSDGVEFWHGRLTYWLLDTIRTNPLSLSSAAICNRICAKIQTAIPDQMPYLMGEGDRFFFGPKFRSQVYAVPVQSLALQKHQIGLAGGYLHGVKENAEYAVLPLNFDLGRRIKDADLLARVKVQEVLSVTSTATIVVDGTPPVRQCDIKEGCPAVLQSLPLEAQAAVRFVEASDQQRTQFEKDWAKHAAGRRLLRLLKKEGDALFTVTVKNGYFQVKDSPGMLTNMITAQLPWDACDSMPRLVRRLEHVMRYHLLRGLENPSCTATNVHDLVDIDVTPAPEYVTLDNNEVLRPARAMVPKYGVYELPEKRLFRITVTNKVSQPVGCTILNFDPEFGIDIVFPGGANYCVIPGYGKVFDDFWVEIPGDQRAQEHAITTADLFKVLVSKPECDVGPLRLAKLRVAEEKGYDVRGEDADENASLTTLEDLLAALRPVHRGGYSVSGRAKKGIDWQTKDIFVRAMKSTYLEATRPHNRPGR